MIQIIASMGAAFSQATSCMMPIIAALVGAYLFHSKKDLCDKTVGKIGGAKGCDTVRRLLFSAGVAFITLILITSITGGGYGGGYTGQMGGYAQF